MSPILMTSIALQCFPWSVLGMPQGGGRKGKIGHGVVGGGGGGGRGVGRMRKIGRGNGSMEAKWVEARLQG